MSNTEDANIVAIKIMVTWGLEG